jgi:hypothetical protein
MSAGEFSNVHVCLALPEKDYLPEGLGYLPV